MEPFGHINLSFVFSTYRIHLFIYSVKPIDLFFYLFVYQCIYLSTYLTN